MTEDDRPAPGDQRPLGMRPGVNGDPLGPAFRDGPRRAPVSVGSILTTVLPFLVLVGVVAFALSR
jgi:hypothetical protein